jgi:hypothetical protein
MSNWREANRRTYRHERAVCDSSDPWKQNLATPVEPNELVELRSPIPTAPGEPPCALEASPYLINPDSRGFVPEKNEKNGNYFRRPKTGD